MSLFTRPSSGGGIDPAALAALVDDNEAAGLVQGLLNTVNSRADVLADAVNNARVAVLDSLPGAGLPVGFVAEFPADQVPATWQVVQGTPEALPTGVGTVSASRTTGTAATQRGFARTLATNRIWSIYGTTLAALDLSTNKYDSQTYSLPAFSGANARGTVLHDLADDKTLHTVGANSASSLGDARAFTFDANSKTFTQVANFQLTGTDGNARAGVGGTTLRLADGRLFWLPSETWRTAASSTPHTNVGAVDGGFYFIYDPVSNTPSVHRFDGWAAALAAGNINETGAGSVVGVHYSLPIGQLPDGRLVLQELATTTSASRYFFLDLAANTITLGTGAWVGGTWALASHPQGLVAFSTGSTARRYYNAATGAMDSTTAATYSSASVSGATQGYCYKALPIGNGNYALPAANGASEAMALAFDSFARLGTVKARKVA